MLVATLIRLAGPSKKWGDVEEGRRREGISRSRKVMGVTMIKTHYTHGFKSHRGKESTCHTGLTT